MKILEITIPDIVLDVFYTWCNLLECSRTESNFMLFIQDCSLHFNEEGTYESKIRIPIRLKVSNGYLCIEENNERGTWTITNQKEETLSPLLRIYKKYLDQIK